MDRNFVPASERAQAPSNREKLSKSPPTHPDKVEELKMLCQLATRLEASICPEGQPAQQERNDQPPPLHRDRNLQGPRFLGDGRAHRTWLHHIRHFVSVYNTNAASLQLFSSATGRNAGRPAVGQIRD